MLTLQNVAIVFCVGWASLSWSKEPPTTPQLRLSNTVPSHSYDEIDYTEPLRPQFHFSSGKNWLNDPNGMVFDGEKYHLFFQHNPLGTEWGNMTWGHATSPNMVQWKQWDHALLPYNVEGKSGTIFSGTAVVDHNNSLEKQRGDVPTLCAFFTFANQGKYYQAMAYSTNRGETWTYWNNGRPVVDNQGFDRRERDPKVFWHEESQQWVMVLWVQLKPGRVRFFTSDNLVDWTFASDLMRDWAFECMDMVFLPVDGDPSRTKAVLYDASFDYEVGTFDGKSFHTEAGPFIPGGGHFYAPQTFNNHPDGRAVLVGWMKDGPNSAKAYGLPFNQQMSFPCELSLKTVGDTPQLHLWPIKEIETLVESTLQKTNTSMPEGKNLLDGVERLDLVDLSIRFDPGTASEIRFDLGRATLRYDCKQSHLHVVTVTDSGEPLEKTAMKGIAPRNGVVELRILVDRLSVESFAFGGGQFDASYYSPLQAKETVSIVAIGGDTKVDSLVLRKLKSAW